MSSCGCYVRMLRMLRLGRLILTLGFAAPCCSERSKRMPDQFEGKNRSGVEAKGYSTKWVWNEVVERIPAWAEVSGRVFD